MGFRTIIEFNHDDISRIENDPEGFVQALRFYIRSASESARNQLNTYNADVVAIRHSSDSYIVRKAQSGFPSVLPFDDFMMEKKLAKLAARDRLGKPNRSKAELEETVMGLLKIIERLEEGEEYFS